MIIVETILLSLLMCTSVYASYIDFRTGLISNKLLGISALIALAADAVYYGFFNSGQIWMFLQNFAAVVILSVLLYGFHFWGAGDSKFAMFIALAIPSRFYADSVIPLPAMAVIVYTFSISFIYLMFESLVLGIKNKDLFKADHKITVQSVVSVVRNFAVSYVYIFLVGFAETLLIKAELNYINVLANFFIILTIFSFDIFKKWYVTAVVFVTDVVLYIVFGRSMGLSLPSAYNLLLVAAIILFRNFANKYNYKTVPTAEIKEGTVLSFGTILKFRGSRVKGLPESTTEDFRSRITAEQAASVVRWGKSKMGEEMVTIVKKLPFAVFITLGTIMFLVMRRLGL